MAEPTQDEIDEARSEALSGVTSTKMRDRTTTWMDPEKRLDVAARIERRRNKPSHCGFARCSKGYRTT